VLVGYPDYAVQLEPMLRLTKRMRALSALQLSPDALAEELKVLTLYMIAEGADEDTLRQAAMGVMERNSFDEDFTAPSKQQYVHGWLWDGASRGLARRVYPSFTIRPPTWRTWLLGILPPPHGRALRRCSHELDRLAGNRVAGCGCGWVRTGLMQSLLCQEE
jgi:hypothetical protein